MDATAGQSCADGSRAEANISNIAQRSVLQTPVVVVCLVGVRNQDLIAENVRSHSFSLNADDPNAIDKVVAKRKGLQGERRYI
jgi:aryl-alcohol dehydrogenase-like predicted oxidoreductase